MLSYVTVKFHLIPFSNFFMKVEQVFLQIFTYVNQLHPVSRTQQDRQREISVKTLRFPLSAKFWSVEAKRGVEFRHSTRNAKDFV